MAKCRLTVQEYTKEAFAPQVAILCSEDADNMCLKNNLRFVDLLQPFTKLNVEASIQDPSGNNVAIKDLKIAFEDMNRRPPQPTLGKKILSDAVSNSNWDQLSSMNIDNWGLSSAMNIELRTSTPWFEVWRELFLQIQYPSDHEFTKHFVACIIVVSSGSENTLDQLNRLSQYQHQQQHQNPARFPKWFSPNILKFYLLIHDISQTENSRAEQLLEQMESAYGASNCYLLKINSRPLAESDTLMPDPWSQFLQHKGLIDSGGGSVNSETSSGTGTPREDIVGLPSRVSEGDSSESSEPIQSHPLSPVVQPPDEKNGIIEGPVMDVPFLLNKESLPSGNISVHHGDCLTTSDLEEIRRFTQEFCLKALIPHIERQIRYLNEVVTNRSRSKSLLSATRRWLGGNKPQTAASNSVIYGQEATELQTRRLGDLCFMFGLYDLAYNAYHTAKNDFKNDQAWLYFAGAQEMAALASFLHGASDFPKRYLDGSLHTYLNVCKVYNFAIRLTLLMTEVFKHFDEYGDAAMCFIKMTSEESDLLSALMLEQAGHCFINARRPLLRKYAFHMTLAGHRFSKAGQKSHSYRTYQQALQVYSNRYWLLAEDHIHYTMGKQAFHLKQLKESVEATTQLINPLRKAMASSHQSASQQLAYVREFLNTLNQYLQLEENLNMLPLLPIPEISGSSIKVLLGTPQPKVKDREWVNASHISFSDEESHEARWFALENDLIKTVQGSPMIFKPNLHRLSNVTPNTSISSVPLRELVCIQFLVKNTLHVSFTLSDIKLIYEFFDESDQPLNDETVVVCETVPGFNLPPESEDTLIVNLVPQRLGRLQIIGISYRICLTVDKTAPPDKVAGPIEIRGKQIFEIKGPRLNSNHNERTSNVYAKDERLNVKVIPEMPHLSIRLKDPPAILSCGELFQSSVVFENSSLIPLTRLYVAFSNPRHMFFSFDEEEPVFSSVRYLCDEEEKMCNLKKRTMEIVLPNGVLNPGQKLSGHLWLHAPLSPGAFDVELLFYYEPEKYPLRNSYRLVRHLSSIYLEPCLALRVSSCPSLCVQKFEKGSDGSPGHTHSFNLVFNIKNKSEMESSPSDLKISGIGGNSKHWAILPHQMPDLPCIGVGENVQFCSQCVCLWQKPKENLFLSYIPVICDEKPPSSSWWKFSLRQRLKLPDLMADPLPPNPAADYIPPPPTKEEIERRTLNEANEIDVVVTVLWRGKRGSADVFGQHNLFLKCLGDSCCVPSAKEFEGSLAVEEDHPPVKFIKDYHSSSDSSTPTLPRILERTKLIKVALNMAKEIRHDFSTHPLCRIEYILSLYNCCGCSLQVGLELASKSTRSPMNSQTQLYSPSANANILAVGASTLKRTLLPWTSCDISLHSIVTSPGIYCLGVFSLRIKREFDEDGWIQRIEEFQSAVVVLTDSHGMIDQQLSSELATMHLTAKGPLSS